MRSSRIFVCAITIAAGCDGDPSPGESCDDLGYLCQDEHHAFECRDHRWTALPCKGPLGCRAARDAILCDWSANTPGEACPSMDVGAGACTADGRQLVQCTTKGIVTKACGGCSKSDREVACTNDGETAPNGGGGVGDVSVVVLVGGIPRPSTDVVFHDAAGTPLAHLQTGSDGRSRFGVSAGAIVTVAVGSGASTTVLWSWFDVEPGDELRFVIGDPAVSPDHGDLHVSIPNAVPSATGYWLGYCNGAGSFPTIGSPMDVPVPAYCVSRNGTFGLLAYAYATSALTSYSFAAVAAPPRDGEAAVTMPPWSSDFDDFGLQLAKALPGMTRATSEVTLWNDGAPVTTLLTADHAISAGGGATSIVRVPRKAGDSIRYRASVEWADGNSDITRSVAKTALTQSVDLSNDVLPRVRSVSLDLTQEARPAVHWVTDGSMASADSAYVQLNWRASSSAHAWLMQVPPTVTAPLRVPALPNALKAWEPSGAEYKSPGVTFVDQSTVADWKRARTSPPMLNGPTNASLEVGDSIRYSIGGG